MIAGLLRRLRAPRNDTGGQWGRYTRFFGLRPQNDTRCKVSNSPLFYLPPGILKVLCKIIGKTEELEKLTGSLLVDSSKIRNLLGLVLMGSALPRAFRPRSAGSRHLRWKRGLGRRLDGNGIKA